MSIGVTDSTLLFLFPPSAIGGDFGEAFCFEMVAAAGLDTSVWKGPTEKLVWSNIRRGLYRVVGEPACCRPRIGILKKSQTVTTGMRAALTSRNLLFAVFSCVYP